MTVSVNFIQNSPRSSTHLACLLPPSRNSSLFLPSAPVTLGRLLNPTPTQIRVGHLAREDIDGEILGTHISALTSVFGFLLTKLASL